MKTSIIAVAFVALTAPACLAQQLSVEERMCITDAVAKLPPVVAPNVEASRVVERRLVEQPQSQGRRSSSQYPVYRIKVEIDASVAGQRSTYLFNCIQSGQTTLVQPLGIR